MEILDINYYFLDEITTRSVIIFHFEGMSFSSAHDLKQWDFLDNNEIFSEFAQFLFPCSVQILQNIKSFSWLYLSHEYNLNHLGINLLVGGCFGVSSRGAGFVWSFELFSDSSELPRNTSIIER